MEFPLGEPFVVWIEPGAGGERLRGAVEHVPGAQRERFEDAEQLIRFLTRLRRAAVARAGEG